MKNATVNCIILGHRNFGEYDKLIHLYTEEFGKIHAIVKGARKITSKFTGHLETFNICMAELYFGPKNIILTEISTLQNFKHIRENLDKSQNALRIAEVTNQVLYENQHHEDLTSLITETIARLNHSRKSSLITQSYIIKLLDKTGNIPNFKEIETRLEKKYLKFLHYIQTRPLREIEKIKLSKKEQIKIDSLIHKILHFAI